MAAPRLLEGAEDVNFDQAGTGDIVRAAHDRGVAAGGERGQNG